MDQEAVLFRRLPHPGLGLVDHASRIGVRLKSSALLPAGSRDTSSRLSQRSSALTVTSRPATRTALSSRARASPHRVLPPNTPPVTYIQNIVVPLHAPTDEMNMVNTAHAQAFSGTRARCTTLGGRRVKTPCLLSASTTHNSAARSSSSSPSDAHDTSTMQTEAGSVTRDSGRWNRSEQAMRFACEQESVSKSRTRKRTSEASSAADFTCCEDPTEIQPHRVDRTYYMSGSNLQLQNRYLVDEAELSQLKEMATARRQAKHYGRRISHGSGVSCTTVLHTSEVPRQPPPSSMGDAETVADGLLVDDTVINDTRTVVTTEDQQAAAPEDPDEGIGMEAPPGACDVGLADVETSQCDRACPDVAPEAEDEPERESAGPDMEEVAQDPKESSLETQRDSASLQGLDSSRHTGSLLTLTGTEISTARSDPWKGALIENEAELDPDPAQSEGPEQGHHDDNADSKMDQSEDATQSEDHNMDQSQVPEQVAVADDISVSSAKEDVGESPELAELSEPVDESQREDEHNPDKENRETTKVSGSGAQHRVANKGDCQTSNETCSKKKEATNGQGPAGDVMTSCNPSEVKPRPLSPCQGH